MVEEVKTWTIGALLKWTQQYFGDKGVDNPRLDAELLLCHVLGKDRVYLYVHFDQPLQKEELAAFRALVKQRASRTPVAYILGEKGFMGLTFFVSPAVLIPRPETELLVEAVLETIKSLDKPRILDLGAGSGKVFTTVTLPLIKDSFFSGLVTSFVRSITAISAIILLVTPQFLLITVQINEFAEKGSYGLACAFATILIIITYGSVLLMNTFIKHFGTSKKIKEVTD